MVSFPGYIPSGLGMRPVTTMATGSDQQDCFKEEFKRYKKRSADLRDVIDFRHPAQFVEEIVPVCVSYEEGEGGALRASTLGLSSPHLWKMYRIVSVPGLIVIPDPFLSGCQHRWVRQCLVGYPCRPNVCNLDAHVERSGEGRIWPTEEEAADVASDGLKGPSKNSLLYKLRWVTLGYHYDWNTKEYYSDWRSPFPEDLARLSAFILEVAGFSKFVPEAAIVNYYHLDSTLSGHTDHSEKDLSIPLLSVSFGQSAIFLVGGRTKQVKPKALLLHSGDIVIMSGESRLVFHGVPRVLPPPPETLVPECLSLAALERQQEVEHINHSCCICGAKWDSRPEFRVLSSQLSQSVAATEGAEGQQLRTGLGSLTAAMEAAIHEHTDHHCDDSKTHISSPVSFPCCGPPETDAGCPACQQLVSDWPQFVQYLSVSRINVNVRQVVSEKHKF